MDADMTSLAEHVGSASERLAELPQTAVRYSREIRDVVSTVPIAIMKGLADVSWWAGRTSVGRAAALLTFLGGAFVPGIAKDLSAATSLGMTSAVKVQEEVLAAAQSQSQNVLQLGASQLEKMGLGGGVGVMAASAGRPFLVGGSNGEGESNSPRAGSVSSEGISPSGLISLFRSSETGSTLLISDGLTGLTVTGLSNGPLIQER